MNMPYALFPAAWHVLAVFATLLTCVWLFRSIAWRALLQTSQLHLLLGFAVFLMLMWRLNAGVEPGLNLHLLGTMVVTLALGPPQAVLAMSVALLGIMLNGVFEWQSWAINFVLMVLVPVGIATMIRNLAVRFLPTHLFVYIFIVAFMGSGATAFLQGFIASLSLAWSGAYSLDFLFSGYLPSFVLLGFAEAWLSGAAITLLIVFKPDWVSSFDDKRYLYNK